MLAIESVVEHKLLAAALVQLFRQQALVDKTSQRSMAMIPPLMHH